VVRLWWSELSEIKAGKDGQVERKSGVKKRIGLIIPTLDRGGAEKQLVLLAKGLDRSRFEPHVILLTRDGPYRQELEEAGVPVTLIGKRFKLDIGSFFRLVRFLKDQKFDLVHTWIFAANSYGRLAAQRAKIPHIVAGERCVDEWKRWWHFAIDRYLARRTDKIVTNSSGVVEFGAAHGIQRSLFEVIPNAVPPLNADETARAEIRRQLGLPSDAVLIGVVGRLWPQKGLKDLLWGMELIRVVRDDAHLVIVGDGPERQRLEYYRDQLGLGHRVRFVGHQDRATRWIQALDLLWNGSLYEGQSNAILEAMQSGVPVLATDIAGNRDLIVPGETGFLYRRGDLATLARRTQQILNNKDLYVRFSASSRQRVAEKFSLRSMIEAHERLYSSLLGA
jgi:glycosyltransferase involved in cell wall biosynthesis